MSKAIPKEAADTNSDELERLRAENARLKSELKEYETFLDNLAITTSEMFWRTDAEHRFTYMSESVTDVTGEPLPNQLGQTRVSLSADDVEQPHWEAHLKDLAARRPFNDFRYKRRRTDGALRDITTSGRPIFNEDGAFQGYVGVAADITDRLIAEDKAKSAEVKLIGAINALEITISFWDSDDRLAAHNEYFTKLNAKILDHVKIGCTFEEYMHAAMPDRVKIDPKDYDSWLEARLQRHRNPGEPFEVSMIDDRVALVREKRLEDGSTILMSTDITAQKDIENALRKSEERLRDFSSVAADWFWEMDADLRFLPSIDTNKQTSVYDLNNFVGLTSRETKPLDVREDDMVAHERQLANREPIVDFRFSRIGSDGKKKYVSVSGTPVFDPNGEFIGYRGVGRDITERVLSQQEILHEKERAERANRAKSQFLAHMSHELRTPLNAILGLSDIIHQEMFGPIGTAIYKEYAQDIRQSGHHLLSLINDLLDLSKIEAGKFKLSEEAIDLRAVLARVERLLNHQFTQRGIRCYSKLDKNARKLWGDHRAVSQILFNLLSNAEKFNKVEGRIDVTSALDETGGIVITIADTGCGFEVNETRAAMAPFERIENPLTKAVPGSGLGLPIVNALMGEHGGRMKIESKIGQGTKVSLSFPPKRTLSPDD